MPETTTEPDPQDAARPVAAASRREVTAGTAPAPARGTGSAGDEPAGGSQAPGAGAGRRGVLLGLLSAGAAAVVGAAASAVRERSRGGAHDGVLPTGRTVEVTLGVEGMRFVPDTVTVEAGDRLVITLDNTSDQVHDLVLDTGATTGRVRAGHSARLEAGVVTGPIQGWCSIAGHRAQGMVMQVVVGAAALGTDAPVDHEAHAGHGTQVGSAVDLQAPLPPGFTPYDAALAPAADQSVHRVTLTVTEVEQAYVGAGVYQTRWTYNGTVPGPVLRGKVGDTFEVTLVNEGTMSHSVDFHAGIVSPDEPMRSIGPGESLVYTFTAQHSGIWLYHCSTAPMSLHLASGMYGAVIIDPDGLGEVDREYLLIQAETYLADSGQQEGAATGAASTALTDKIAAKTPDLLCFNGVAFQYALAPLQARAGERVRLWVLDAGPSLPSSFHVVGLQLDTVFVEGTYLLGGPQETGRAWHGGSQALALQPAQGGFVEAVVPAAGHYAMVTHVFADMEKGAKGVLEAV